MNKEQILDNFLKYYAQILKQNPDLTLYQDTFYYELMNYGLTNEEIKDNNISNYFLDWTTHFKNSNLYVGQITPQPGFCQFVNKEGFNQYSNIKIYLSFNKKEIKSCVNQIFDYINKNNMATRSKVSHTIRSDSVVIRLNKIEDAKQFLEYINNDNYLKSCSKKVNPFLINDGIAGLAYDRKISYNAVLAFLLEKYFNQIQNYDEVNLSNFKQFVNTYYNSIFIQKDSLPEFLYEKEVQSNIHGFSSIGDLITNYFEVIGLIKMSLDKDTTLHNYYNYIKNCQNVTYIQKVKDLYSKYINKNYNISITEKRQIFNKYLDYAFNNYNDIELTNQIQNFLKGQINSLSKNNKYYNSMINHILPNDIISITNNNLNNYIKDRYTKIKKKSIDKKEMLLNAYLDYAIATYGFKKTIDFIENYYLLGREDVITREHNFRDLFTKYLSPVDILNITKFNLNNYIINKYPECVNEDNPQILLSDAITYTINKYGKVHGQLALQKLLEGDSSYISNGNDNYRDRINLFPINVYKHLVSNIIKENKSNISNQEFVISKLCKTAVTENNIISNEILKQLQEEIKKAMGKYGLRYGNQLVNELLMGNTNLLLISEESKLLSSIPKEDIIKATYILLDGYNNAENNDICKYIVSQNLENLNTTNNIHK